MEMLTEEARVELRRANVDEVGTESPCPFCGKPRLRRTTYVRCTPCGTNWLDGENTFPEYLDQDPRISRRARLMGERRVGGPGPSKDGGASSAGSGTGEVRE